MNNKLICPFCNKKLEPIGTSGQFQCGTWGCDASFNFIATRDVWEYIDRTRKALDVAVDALNTIKGKHDPRCAVYHIDEKTAYDALEQITALTKGGNNEQ